MKKMILFILIGLFLLSCGKDIPNVSIVKPIADFNITQIGNYAPSAVNFNDNSSNATNYFWNFGDGETSTEIYPKHIFKNGGSYNVTLRVTNTTGESTITRTVVISSAPTKLKITNLVLIAYPLTTPSGGGWDSGSGPDIYPEITYSTGKAIYSSIRKEDVVISQLPLTYPVNFIFTDLTYRNQIDFYDYDPIGSNEWMGGYYFTVSNCIPTDGSKYPTSLNFTGGSVEFTANMEWIP